MNKKIICALLACIMFAGTLAAQAGGEPVAGSKPTTGEKKGWPSVERYSFLKECVYEAKKGMSEDSARFYCYCMQERMEKKYPTIEEASKVTEEDMESPAFKKDINECLAGTWDSKSRKEFLVDCINSATTTVGEAKAKTYCECMLFKIEKAYPDPAEANKLTADELGTPAWQKTIQGCRDF